MSESIKSWLCSLRRTNSVAVGKKDDEYEVGCTVGAEVVAPIKGSKVILSLVQRFVSRVCVRCQVGSKVDSLVCEELVRSTVGEKNIV
jgi:hypothetical protein